MHDVQSGRHRMPPTKKWKPRNRTLRWSRLALWAERAVLVPKKVQALLWAMTGLTVLNVSLTTYARIEDIPRTAPIWMDPGQSRIITLFDDKQRTIGYSYITDDKTTTCKLVKEESYTCQGTNVRR